TYEDAVRNALINGSGAWDAGYSAATAQYSGFGIDIDQMAGAMYTATSAADAVTWGDLVDNLNDYLLVNVVDKWRRIARSALEHIEKQADA
ncbi:hypothetical protein IAE22_32375, partial [Bacillus sp. S34]|nr:hypothetical protein [Bacillus sp. S34]